MGTYTREIVAIIFCVLIILVLVASFVYVRLRRKEAKEEAHQRIFGFRPAKTYDPEETNIVRQKLAELDQNSRKATEDFETAARQWRHGQIAMGELRQLERERVAAARQLETATRMSERYGGPKTGIPWDSLD